MYACDPTREASWLTCPDCHFQLLELVNIVYSEEHIELHRTGMLSRHSW